MCSNQVSLSSRTTHRNWQVFDVNMIQRYTYAYYMLSVEVTAYNIIFTMLGWHN